MMTTPAPSPADQLQEHYNQVVASMQIVYKLQVDPTTPPNEFMDALEEYLSATWAYHWYMYDTPHREGNAPQ